MKDDEETIEVLIGLARMRVIEVLKPERQTSSQRSKENWREARAERKKIKTGRMLDVSFHCKDSVGVISLHRKQGHPKLSQK